VVRIPRQELLMPVSLSIKNVPDDLAEKLRRRATRHHRWRCSNSRGRRVWLGTTRATCGLLGISEGSWSLWTGQSVSPPRRWSRGGGKAPLRVAGDSGGVV